MELGKTYRQRLQEELKQCEAKLDTPLFIENLDRRRILNAHITYLKFHIKKGIPKGIDNSIALNVDVDN